ncbi:B3/4 domain-containing protein [Geminocystis sp. NIES-3709]|uniref:B3/B4 domain-containing protein n=1 Tax=Geminocystis sp. NIES-3709 TaxID=1617448 RepID=UPI0005FC8739|nr:phenylalanine--tRNA ligase beta subunit-related protein [Geminocystis sp. NIES-3709]BAQ66946.1 hypothetical protein GM3709_3711 [Geminocystis sp. NIES-3709]
MNYKLNIHPQIQEQYPNYSALIIYANGLINAPSDDYSTKLLRQAEEKQRQIFGNDKPSSHSHIAAWREVFKGFGANSSKYLCSVEALLSRTLKGNYLPTINRFVDIYNAVSINHLIPIGGEDLDQLTSDLTLQIATGKEHFITYQNGQEIIENPKPNEVIWADNSGVTCRRWNWRQCHRTALTINTSNAYFVLDILPPYSIKQLMDAGNELIQHLKYYCPNCNITQNVLS